VTSIVTSSFQYHAIINSQNNPVSAMRKSNKVHDLEKTSSWNWPERLQKQEQKLQNYSKKEKQT
jgi:hypothetical protein